MVSFSIKHVLLLLPLLKISVLKNEICLMVKTKLSNKILFFLKQHFNFQFKLLSCVSGIDNPNFLHRFKIVYELLSLRYNQRIRVKFLVDELMTIESAESVFPSSNWWECEIWDLFGVFFSNHSNLMRILTDYGFDGYPLRKDFPLSGFYEAKYNNHKNRVVYTNLELCQEYRTLNFNSPWEKNLDEKTD